MRTLASAAYCVGVALAAKAADLVERTTAFQQDIDASPRQTQGSEPRGLRKRKIKEQINELPEISPGRKLQDVLRYVPIKLDISIETSQSGDVDTKELGGFVGGHIITYLEQTLVDYEPVSVETEVTILSELFRRLERNETPPYILQARSTGYVYFAGDCLPTSKYLNDVIEDAFVGDQQHAFLEMMESADDPVLRSATRVWSGMGSSQEAYLPVVKDLSANNNNNTFSPRIIVIVAGVVSGVILIALFAGLRYRRSIEEKDIVEDASLAEIPWLSAQAPKVVPPKRTSFDLQSTMEAPIEAVAGDTASVMIAVGSEKPEKVALRDDISAINDVPSLQMALDDKTQVLIKLYEESLDKDKELQRKSVSFEDEVVAGSKNSSVLRGMTPQSATFESNQGEEVQIKQYQINQVFSDDQSKRSALSSSSKKFALRKKVSFPTWKAKRKSMEHNDDVLEVIEEEEEVSSKEDEVTLDNVTSESATPVAFLATSESEETDVFPIKYNMDREQPEMGGIFAAISKTESGIKEAWENISKKYSMDPNWDISTSASSRDFEDSSFEWGLGPTCVSSMTDSMGAVDDISDDEEDSADSEMYSQYTSSEHTSQFTASEYNSVYTNPSTNASLNTYSSYESSSTISEDEYSR